MKTYEKMTGFTEAFAKKNYLRVVEKSQTYGYTMFPVKQTHMKKEPAKVCCCLASLAPRSVVVAFAGRARRTCADVCPTHRAAGVPRDKLEWHQAVQDRHEGTDRRHRGGNVIRQPAIVVVRARVDMLD